MNVGAELKPPSSSSKEVSSAEEDVYEISDFTASTEWEKFIKKLEIILHEFEELERPGTLSNDELLNAEWRTEIRPVSLGDKNFVLCYWSAFPCQKSEKVTKSDAHAATDNLLSMHNTFPLISPFERWFGLCEFIVLRPKTESDIVANESLSNLVVSSFNVALSGSKWSVFIVLPPKTESDIVANESLSNLVVSSFNVALSGSKWSVFIVLPPKTESDIVANESLSNLVVSSFNVALSGSKWSVLIVLPPKTESDIVANESLSNLVVSSFNVALSGTKWSVFIVLRPKTESDIVANESLRNLVISSFNVALIDHGFIINLPFSLPIAIQPRPPTIVKRFSNIPMLMQICRPDRDMYAGCAWSRTYRTTFSVAHLEAAPRRYIYLPGVFELFRGKVQCPVSPEPPIKLSVRLSYRLREQWDHWPHEPPEILPESIPFSGFQQLPFGACLDPIRNLNLYATWLCIDEHVMVENEISTDLDPVAAPDWRLSVDYAPHLKCLLSGTFNEMLKTAETVNKQYVTFLSINPQETDPSLALNRLTEDAVPTISSLGRILGRSAKSLQSVSSGPIDDQDLTAMLSWLFPDVDGNQKTSLSPSSFRKDSYSETIETGRVERDPMEVKSAPLDSLTGRLALLLSHVLGSMQGVQAFCQTWREFVLELKYRWEQGESLPLLEEGHPDLSQCELHQELRMLNCCIKAKSKQRLKSEDDSEEIFYDALEANSEDTEPRKPEGRLKRLKEFTLLKSTDAPLFIPAVQDPPPQTERLLHEQSTAFSQLGESKEASSTRARMQAASLFSDMEAFKAANPGSSLADFVRWFSPRDFIGDNGDEARLSDRMSLPGNMWQQAWDLAAAVPAVRQRPLFDATNEAEKILCLLDSKTVAEIAQLILPVLLSHCLDLLSNEASEIFSMIPDVSSTHDVMWQRLRKNGQSASNSYSFIVEAYKSVHHDLEALETTVSRHRALQSRFESIKGEKDAESLLLDLLSGREVQVTGAASSHLGKGILDIFRSTCDENEPGLSHRFPPHWRKEYILTWSVPRPEAFSRNIPQRLYVAVSDEEFRLAMADSTDVTFY